MAKLPATRKPQAAATKVARQSRPYTLPTGLGEMLAPVHILRTEDIDAYDTLMDQFTDAIGPQDFVEWMWVRDLTDQTWEELRAKRARAVRLKLARRETVELILKSHYPANTLKDAEMEFAIQKDVADIMMGEEIPKAGFDELRRQFGVTGLDNFGAAYQSCLADMERLQRIADRANARRNMTLREIDRRRDAAARRAREAITAATVATDAIDAEFE